MRGLRRLVGLAPWLVALLALATPARAGAEGGVVLSYEMWQGGLRPFKIEFRLANTFSGYRAAFQAETSGIVGWAYPYRVDAQSEGRNTGHGPRPVRFRSFLRKPGKERLRWITYREDGSPEPGFDPPRKGTSDDEPTEEQTADTLDPVSGLVAVIDRVRDSGRCAGTIPIYDGKRVYRLHVTDRGKEKLESGSYGVVFGEATVCRLRVVRVAGFRKKNRHIGFRYMPSEMDIWFAPVVPGQVPVPVRMEGKSGLGNIVVHLVSVTRGQSAREAKRPAPSKNSLRGNRPNGAEKSLRTRNSD